MHMNTKTTTLTVGLSALLAGAVLAGPGKEVVVPVEEPKGFCDYYNDIFSHAKIYSDPGNPLIQEIKFTGRYHGQYHDVESDLGDDSDWENRRFRFGADVKFLNSFKFKSSLNLRTNYSDPGRFVRNIDEMVIEWAGMDNFVLTGGKQKMWMGRDWNTSSKNIKTIERSILTNNLIVDKSWGLIATIEDLAGFTVNVGGFVGGVDSDWAWADWDSGYALNFSVARAITKATELRFDYLYNDGDPGNNGFRRFENTFSLNSQSDWDRLHLATDLQYGTGIGSQEDIYGVVIMPYYDITDKLEAVFRYTWAGSDSPRGLSLQSREERKTTGTSLRADDYHAFYGGLNWYVCGDKLKIMNGVEYSMADGATDSDFWTYWTGIRMYF